MEKAEKVVARDPVTGYVLIVVIVIICSVTDATCASRERMVSLEDPVIGVVNLVAV